MKPLEDKVAIITGAGGGIGRAAALVFARDGAVIVASDRDRAGLERTVAAVTEAGGRAAPVLADVSRRDDVDALVEYALGEFGRLDCAFNNAGIAGPLATLLDYPEEEFRRVLDVNVGGVWNCLRAEIPAMLRTGGGAIVNSSSGLGVVASPNMSAYVAAKHAVMGLTQAAAIEYAEAGVRVNAVLPGVIDTEMPARLAADSPETREAMVAAHPAGRLGRADEVAEAAAWLCSSASSYVNGHGMAIDGAYLSQ